MPATLKKVSTLRPSAETQGRVRPRGVMCSVTTLLEVLARNCAAVAEADLDDLSASSLGGGEVSLPLEKSGEKRPMLGCVSSHSSRESKGAGSRNLPSDFQVHS